ncbi:MAG: LysR substrate-binding domain-containing protein [Caulobacteraceae bacterium]
MKYRYVRAFLAIVETGSIRTASRRLGVSQPALTKTLQELEALLGASLITRTAQGSAPTEFGRAFFARAKFIDEELRRAQEEIDQMRGGKDGAVSVGLSPVASLLMAAEALSRFRLSFPNARVKIADGIFDLQLAGVRQGRFDFAIGGLPPSALGPDVEAEPLFRNRLAPWVRQDHPLAGARSLADLTDADWVFTNDDPNFLKLVHLHFEHLKLPPPRVALTCESFPTVLELIPKTDLVALFPESLTANPLVAARMVPIPVEEPPPTTSLSLIKRSGVPLTPVAEHLATHFRRIARRFSRLG